jgi:hypothetical protein
MAKSRLHGNGRSAYRLAGVDGGDDPEDWLFPSENVSADPTRQRRAAVHAAEVEAHQTGVDVDADTRSAQGTLLM